MKIVITSLIFSLTVALCSSHVLVAADEQQQGAAKTTFLVIYRPGPCVAGWKVGFGTTLERARQVYVAPVCKRLHEARGALTDNAGGAVVLAVANESEAKTIVTEDRAVKDGTFVYEMHPWELKPWGKYAKKK